MNGINPYASYIVQTLLNNGSGNQSAVQQADIIDVPSRLKNLATSLILKGEVKQNNRDGTTIIETKRGNFTVKLDTPLQNGSELDIQIPPQNKGKNQSPAIIQPTLIKAVSENQQSQSNTIQIKTEVAALKPQNQLSNTIQDVKSLQNTAQQATLNTNPILSKLAVGQAVRISALPVALNSTQALPLNFKSSTSLPLILQNTLPKTVSHPTTTLHPSVVSPQPHSQFSISTPPPQVISRTEPTIFASKGTFIHIPIVGQTATPIQLPTALHNIFLPALIVTPNNSILTANTSNTPLSITDARVQKIQSLPVQLTPSANSFTPKTPVQTNTGQAGQITATVTGFINDDGNPIIQTLSSQGHTQYSTLHYPAKNLHPGTVITLTPMTSNAVKSSVSLPLSSQTQSWQSMAQLFQTLGPLMGQNGLQNLMTLMPQATQTKQFPAAALLFLAAAKGGDLSGWLGTRPMRLIDQAPQNTKSSLDSLMKEMVTHAVKTPTPSDPPMVQNAPEWRGYNLPIGIGVNIQNAVFWVKDEEGQNKNDRADKEKGMRFVVDLELSRMGNVYFDGYVDKAKKLFDLALMTERQMTPSMQTAIKTIWHKTMDNIDMDGQLLFKDIK